MQVILEGTESDPELRVDMGAKTPDSTEPLMVFGTIERAEPLSDVVELGVKRRSSRCGALDAGEHRAHGRGVERFSVGLRLSRGALGFANELQELVASRERLIIRHASARCGRGDALGEHR